MNSGTVVIPQGKLDALQQKALESGGMKFDGGKPPLALLPWEAVTGVASVLGFGAAKYASWNWRKGLQWARLASAGLRHVFAFLSGEDLDPESGLPHIDHALCCFMFLSAHYHSKLGTDDRASAVIAPVVPKSGPQPKWYLVTENGYRAAGPFVTRTIAEQALNRDFDALTRPLLQVKSFTDAIRDKVHPEGV